MGSWSISEWLAGLSLAGVVATMLATMLLAAFAGYAIREAERRRALRRNADSEAASSQESYLVGSMLGFLALLMAFSFSMALGRYEERRHLVVEEANAIGTAYLRSQLLDEPHRGRLSQLLVAYTDNRIALAGMAAGQGAERLSTNDRLLTDIWAAVTSARDSARVQGVSVPLLNAFNEVIDLDTERKVARQVRVPAPVLLLLYFFLLLTALVLGYALEERRGRLGALVLFILLSFYVSIIADLSRPASGSILESQEPMLMLQASLKAQPPAAFDRFAAPAKAAGQ